MSADDDVLPWLGDVVRYQRKQWTVIGRDTLTHPRPDGVVPIFLLLERPRAGQRPLRERVDARKVTLIGRQSQLPGVL